MHYSILIQGSLTNGTFKKINPYKYRNPTITFFTVLFRPNQVMFNNIDSFNVVRITNDKKRRIPIGYYSIGEIIAMLNTMTDTPFSISNEASSKDVFGFSHLIQLISALPQIFEKSSIWKDLRSFYPLRSMDRTWLISHKIVN